MRLGVFAKTFPGTTPGPVLAAVKAAGYDGAQWNYACSGLDHLPEAIPSAVAQDLADASAATGVRVDALSATFNMIHPDPAVRAAGLRALDAIGGSAAAVGCDLVNLCTGTRDPDDMWRAHPANGDPDAWRDLLATFAAAVAIADRHDLRLGIEPEPGNVIRTTDGALRLMAEVGSPRVVVILDPANLVEGNPAERWGDLVDDAIDRLGDRIALGHAKNRAPDGRVVPPGSPAGGVDFPRFVAGLRRAGFNGPMVAHGFGEADAPAVAAYLRECGVG